MKKNNLKYFCILSVIGFLAFGKTAFGQSIFNHSETKDQVTAENIAENLEKDIDSVDLYQDCYDLEIYDKIFQCLYKNPKSEEIFMDSLKGLMKNSMQDQQEIIDNIKR